jgi:hypothetical protein
MTMDAQVMQTGGPWMSIPRDAAAAHSRDNIRRWSAYLPKSCIKSMIEMGWDSST